MAGYNRGQFGPATTNQQQMMNMTGVGGPQNQQIGGIMYNQSGMMNPQQQPQRPQSGQQQQQSNPSEPQNLPNNPVVAGGDVNPLMSQSAIPQQQAQQQQQLPNLSPSPLSLTLLGQETVQDISTRFQEIFSALKLIQPNRENNPQKRVQELLRTIRLLFKRVRIIYDKCNNSAQGMEYTHVESLIPYKDEPDHRSSEITQSDEYKKALQENRELIETVILRNKQLREIIDRTRVIIWEINTMLSMRRS